MKRPLIIFLAASVLLFASGSVCPAGDGPGFGFHKMYLNKTEISLYVNGAIGQDKHGHGRFPHKPYQTISFALEAVPLVRKSADIRVTINVAAGTYNENFYIRLDNIIIQGDEQDATIIMGNGADDAVEIFNAKRIRLIGLKITNGYNGISTSFASLVCERVSLIDNQNNGLSANNNSYVRLDNVIASSNANNAGVSVNRASTVRIFGGDFSGNRRGLYGSRNSIADILAYNITNRPIFENNSEEGLFANTGTVIRLEDAYVGNSGREGVRATRASIIRMYGGNLISENCEPWQNCDGGIRIQDNSYLSSDGDDKISNNKKAGVSLLVDSTARFHRNTSVTNNVDYGIFCDDDEIRIGRLPGTLSGNNSGGDQTNCIP